jgi:polysaccharide biosynthesis protein PslG
LHHHNSKPARYSLARKGNWAALIALLTTLFLSSLLEVYPLSAAASRTGGYGVDVAGTALTTSAKGKGNISTNARGGSPIIVAPGPGGGSAIIPTPTSGASNPTPTPGSSNPGSTPISVTPNAATSPLKGPHVGYGMNVWLFGQDKERVLNLVKDAGFGWVRQQVGWDALEPSPGQFNWGELDSIVQAANSKQIQLIFSVVRAPHWAGINGTSGLPANPAVFTNTMYRLAQRYKGRVAAYEIWNEQNLALETGGRVMVGAYVEALKAGYRGVKAADSQAVVIYGGLSPSGIVDPNYAIDDALFLEQCYKYNNGEMRNYFDVLGVHPGNHANSPDEFWPNDPPADKTRGWTNHPSFYFRRIENLRAIMEQYGDSAKQVWLTEFGWTTKNLAPGYEYGALISEDTQAQYIVRAYQRAKEKYPWMGVMNIWQLNFATLVGPNDEKAPWGLIRADWSLRPAYLAVKAMPK